MVRLLAACVLSAAAGCHCGPRPAPPPPPPPLDVSPGVLVRLYRDTPALAADTYSGRRVRCRLQPTTYRLTAGGVGWVTGFADTPPAVVFSCADPAPAGLSPAADTAEVVGLCAGVVYDGIRRGPGIDWYVSVTGCSATRHQPAAPPP